VGKWQRLQQRGVDEAEHRGVDADAHSKEEDHGGGESRLAPEAADARPYILPQGVNNPDAFRVTCLITDEVDSAKST
jgi:hypothetical protein